MSFNMRDYVSSDHIESIGEIAKSQSAIIQALSLENSKLQNQLQQKENIMKEVRKKLVNLNDKFKTINGIPFNVSEIIEMIEMLDKEVN